jgi:hypothetical protein
MDYRKMYDRELIFAYDLDGRDVTLTISKVVAGELTGTGGKKNKKPIVYFDGKDRGLGLCKTNAKVIASLYGTSDTREWVGKRVTLYPTKTTFGGNEVDCIRIRNVVPSPKGRKTEQDDAPPSEEAAQ